MNLEIIKLSILTFLAGILCKVYDDLNDNDLFISDFMKKNKEFINEFLKGLTYILITYISSTYIYPILLFLIPNTFLFFLNPEAYKMPYEFSGTLAVTLWGIYLIIQNFNKLDKLFCFRIIISGIILYGLITYFLDIFLFKNVEFGLKKLVVRGFITIFTTTILLANYYLKIVPDEVIYCFWYWVGYFATSCMFQTFFLLKSKNDNKEEIIEEKPQEEVQQEEQKEEPQEEQDEEVKPQ
jgi:hypothetical protein